MAKQGKQTRSDKLKRDTKYHQVLEMDDNTHLEGTSPFLMFFVVFIRHGFGSRYLKTMIKRVLFSMLGFALGYWAIFAFFGMPEWMEASYYTSYWTFGIMAVLFLMMTIYRRSKIKLDKLRRFEVYSWSSGHSYFLPLGRKWINFLNRRAVSVQKVWNWFLSEKNKFEPRRDVFWNDVGATRKYVEPFLAFCLVVLFYLFKQLLPCLWFAFVFLSVRGDASRFIQDYHRNYDNMQDNELIAENKARVLRRRQKDENDIHSRIRKAIEFGDTSAVEEELRQEGILLKEEMKQIKKEQTSHKNPPVRIKEDNFSLDDAFDSLNEDVEK